MQQQFLGIDIAGDERTRMCVLRLSGDKLVLAESPSKVSLEQIIQYADAEENLVAAVAIDAQLTWAVSDEARFRKSDKKLKCFLPPSYQNWVASQNSLMAVPVRGRQLAEYLSPIVGTIIETHPRACLYFAVKSAQKSTLELLISLYKNKKVQKQDRQDHTEKLWQFWTEQFGIDAKQSASDLNDDALDSLVCATMGYLFHHSPDKLRRMTYSASDKRGRGPFFVLQPTSKF